MSHFFITGGAGFIGSHLAEALLRDGAHVSVLDDLSGGSVKNIEHLRADPRFRFVCDSVTSPGAVAEMMDGADVVFHLAATVGVFNVIESPVKTIENNIEGTKVVLRAAARKKTRVIIASTSEVYGKSTQIPFRENRDLVSGPTTKSRWSYAASKVVAEFLALAYWKESHVPSTIVRLFNTIGPRQTGLYGMVVPRFFSQALAGRNLTVYGTGHQMRCFAYVSDIVAWLRLLAAEDRSVGEIYNLGNPTETSILGLANHIIEITDAPVGIDFVPYDEAYEEGFEDIKRRVPDISRIEALTGYSPRIGLHEALTRIKRSLEEERILGALSASRVP